MQYTLAQIAEIIAGEVHGDPGTLITGVASLERAVEGDLSFAQDDRYFDKARQSRAAAFVLPQPLPDLGKPAILNPMPKLAFGMFLGVIAQHKQAQKPGVHASAIVADAATLGQGISIGANAVIGEGAQIGDRVTVYAGAYIGDRCEIGEESVIHANVTIREETIIGKRTIVHAGAVIGADGYGYVQHEGHHVKIPQSSATTSRSAR